MTWMSANYRGICRLPVEVRGAATQISRQRAPFARFVLLSAAATTEYAAAHRIIASLPHTKKRPP